jgi:hypothetical protein
LWYPYEKYKSYFEQGRRYISFSGTSDDSDNDIDVPPEPPQALLHSSLDNDRYLFRNGPRENPPYDPYLDIGHSDLFKSGMPGVHPRELIVQSEGFWGKFLYVREGEFKKYWMSDYVEDSGHRELLREMIAILGSLMFEIIILTN